MASAVVLDDLEAFFETINRNILIEEAQRLGVPLAILRASLAAYVGPRMITLNGRAAKELHARHGVLPGCTFATTYVKIFYVRRLDALVTRLPEGVDLDVYIDDIALSAEGTTADVVTKLAEAREALHEVLTKDLKCRIAPAKSCIVASSGKVSRMLANKLGMKGAVRRCAPNLGVDATAGGRRKLVKTRGAKRRTRLAGSRLRGHKLAGIAKTLGSRAIKVYTTGIAPEANFGAEVWGISDSEALKLRRVAAMALKPRSRCRSLTTVHLVNRFPTARDEVRTVIHDAKQIWRAATDREAAAARGMSLPEIRRLWEAAHRGVKAAVDAYGDARIGSGGAAGNRAARKAWDSIRGPVGAAALTLARLGWRFGSAFELVDAHGDIVGMTTTSPAMVAKLLASAAQDECERIVGRAWAETDAKFAGRRICADLAVRAIRDGMRHVRDHIEIGALRAAVCGGICTRSRAVANGYAVADECPKCGAAGDTPHHRTYCCPETERAVLRHIPQWVYNEGRRASPSDKFWTTAAFPHPGDLWPRPTATIEGKWTIGDADDNDHDERDDDDHGHHQQQQPTQQQQHSQPAQSSSAVQQARQQQAREHQPEDGTTAARKLGGLVYGDGSYEPNEIRGLGRAAVAMVEVNSRGDLVQAFSFPLPRAFPQTSQAGEYVMLAQSRRMLGRTARVASDCLNVVVAAGLPARRALAPGKLYAGVNLDKWQMADHDKLISAVRWVKSHRALNGREDAETQRDIKANALADRLAKEAVRDHQRPAVDQRADLAYYVNRAPHVAKAVAVALAAFPPSEDKRMTRIAKPRDRDDAVQKQLHWWSFDEGSWRCRICGKWAVGDDLRSIHHRERCQGPRPSTKRTGGPGGGIASCTPRGRCLSP